MKKMLIFLLFSFLTSVGYSQNRTVNGKVLDGTSGQPVERASVQIKGKAGGVAASNGGTFSIVAGNGDILIISAINYTSKEISVGNDNNLTVSLERASGVIDEVVVTALGVSRSTKSLGYAAQKVDAEKLNATKTLDINTALAGKVSGIQIRGGSGAKFGTSSIRFRGVNTLTGGNPIYVVDGTILTSAQGINPEDVESLTALKGPAATAIYGQRASEGAIVITSKKGKKAGWGIDFNHTTTFEKVYILPEYQNEYGGGNSLNWSTFTYNPAIHPANLAAMNGAKYYNYAVDESWGPKMDGTLHAPWYAWDPTDPEFGKLKPFSPQPDNVRDFFNTGVANNTTLSFSKATEESNTKVSITNYTRSGVIPNSNHQKNFISLSNSINLNKQLTFTLNGNYVNEYFFNVPAEGYGTQTTGSFNQWFQRNVEIEKLKRYKREDGSYTSWNITSPTNLTPQFWDNPYTQVYENTARTWVQRTFGNASLSYKFPMGLKLSAIARGSFYNLASDSRTASFTVGTAFYGTGANRNSEVNYVASAEYDKNFSKISLRAGLFGELRTNNAFANTNSTNGGFIQPNVYTISNSLNEKIAAASFSKNKVNSMYGYANFGFNNLAFVDFTMRNDISSTLPKQNNSYLYGSASGSLIVSSLLPKSDIVNYAKVRASIAKVGTDIGPYNILETYPLGTNYVKPTSATANTTYSLQTVPNTKPNELLRPSLSTSYEIGMELQFLKNRIRMDANYFHRDSKDQIIAISVPGSTGYTSRRINAGNIQNKGYEFTIGAMPLVSRNFSWNVDLNFAFFKNQVVELADGITNLQTALDGSNVTFGFVGSPLASLNAQVGQPFGIIKGQGIKTDAAGNRLIHDDGTFVLEDDKVLGSVTPKVSGGLVSGITYKDFFLNFSMDFQKGGKFVSLTNMINAGSGLGAETVGLNSRGVNKRLPVAQGGGVLLSGINENTSKANTVYVDAKDMYESYLGNVWEYWTYDASYIKLREVSIGYSIPKKMFKKLPFQKASFSLIGQNLWLMYSKVKGLNI